MNTLKKATPSKSKDIKNLVLSNVRRPKKTVSTRAKLEAKYTVLVLNSTANYMGLNKNLMITRREGSLYVNKEPLIEYKGVQVSAFKHLCKKIELSPTDISHVFSITSSTLNRRLHANKPFIGDEADRIVRVAEVYRYAEEVFGNTAKAHGWMSTPRNSFMGYRPVDMLSSTAGVDAVKEYLGRIEYGIFA